MSDRQALVLLNALIFLAHNVVKVKFSSCQVFVQHRCLLSAKHAQERVTDTEAENVVLQFHSRQECDISICDLEITRPNKPFTDPAKSFHTARRGQVCNTFPCCGGKFLLERVYQSKQMSVQSEHVHEAASRVAVCRTCVPSDPWRKENQEHPRGDV